MQVVLSVYVLVEVYFYNFKIAMVVVLLSLVGLVVVPEDH